MTYPTQPRSAVIIFDQAENRFHAQKAILLTLLGVAKRLPNDRENTAQAHHN